MFVLQNTIDDTTQNHIHKIISVDQWKPDTAVYLRFQHLPHWSLRKKAENKYLFNLFPISNEQRTSVIAGPLSYYLEK